MEIIVVDDCSQGPDRRDRRRPSPGVRLIRQAKNGGKGRAVRAGIAAATGDLLIIQDADLEYDPQDYMPMLRALLDGRADIVYGSRYLGRGRHAQPVAAPRISAAAASAWSRGCSPARILTDTVTAFKLFRRDDIAALPLETTGFELDHEITSRMLARGRTIVEVPISYYPRSRDEGKKIGLRDWFIGTRTFWRYRKG